MVGGLRRRLDALSADRAVALADARRARGGRRGDRPRAAGRGADPGGTGARGDRAAACAARTDLRQPARGRRPALLGPRRRDGRVRRGVLRPRLSRRQAAVRLLRDPARARGLGAARVRRRRRGRDRGGDRRRRARDRRRPAGRPGRDPPGAAPAVHEPGPGCGRTAARRRDRARVHALTRRRLRGRRAGDDAQRADHRQLRRPLRPRHRGRRGGRVHLQRADGGPRAARAVPGDRGQPAPAPDPPAHPRRRHRPGGVSDVRQHHRC